MPRKPTPKPAKPDVAELIVMRDHGVTLDVIRDGYNAAHRTTARRIRSALRRCAKDCYGAGLSRGYYAKSMPSKAKVPDKIEARYGVRP